MESAFAEKLETALGDESGRLVVADAPRSEYVQVVEWLLGALGGAGATFICAPPLSFRERERGPMPGAAPDPIPALGVARRLGVHVAEVGEVPARAGAVTLVVLDADNLLNAWRSELFRRASGETRIVLLGCSERPHNRPRIFLETMERFATVPFARIVREAGQRRPAREERKRDDFEDE